MMQTIPFTQFSAAYTLSCIPLFILMGELCFHSKISTDLYDTVNHWIGHFRGGLAMATVGACAMFGAVTGSSAATVATFGTVSLPEMRRHGYDLKLATGTIAAAGGLGILIPPSIIMIVYGLIAGESIGKLFMAGFLPGILKAGLYMIAISIVCYKNPNLGPAGENFPLKEKFISLKGTAPIFILFLFVLGGIYLGIFTATEASGIGAIGALLFALGRRSLNKGTFLNSLEGTARTTAFILFIVLGATMLGYFLTITRLPAALATAIGSWDVDRYVIMAGIIFIYILLGCAMEGLSIVLLTVPVLIPLIQSLGFDLIWYGILMVCVVEMGLITPPVGINVFIMKGIATDVPMYTIFRGIIPFFIANIVFLIIIVAFPDFVTFLPSTMK